jgi:hypothetical protein
MSNEKTNEANHNSKSINELLTKFGNVRNHLVKRMDALDESAILRYGMHPRLNQPMRIIDIAYFTSEHDDQHIAIIRHIINSKK